MTSDRSQALRDAQKRLVIFSVYVIGPISGRPVKIGISHRPHKRLQEIKISHWLHEIALHHEFVIGPGGLAAHVESACHNELKGKGKHLRGEWFDVDATEAAALIELVRGEMVADLEKQKRLEAMTREERVAELLAAIGE